MKKLLNQLLLLYQIMISPWLGPNCRFYPSCSEYSRQSIEKYGAFKGLGLAAKRLFSCHPFHPGGYAPLR